MATIAWISRHPRVRSFAMTGLALLGITERHVRKRLRVYESSYAKCPGELDWFLKCMGTTQVECTPVGRDHRLQRRAGRPTTLRSIASSRGAVTPRVRRRGAARRRCAAAR